MRGNGRKRKSKSAKDRLIEMLGDIPVAIGLRQQGHMPTVARMLGEGASWEEIGKAIGWQVAAAEKWWEMERQTVVLRSPSSFGAYLVAHPSAREPGRFQLTGFDSKGQPYGHTTWDTLEDALASAQGKRVNGQIPVGNASFQIAEK